jgi:hypothetical protein
MMVVSVGNNVLYTIDSEAGSKSFQSTKETVRHVSERAERRRCEREGHDGDGTTGTVRRGRYDGDGMRTR